MAKIESFSKKQLKLLTWWYPESKDSGYDAIICDGAVRSGKTVCMSLSFVLWAFARFDGGDFAICGQKCFSAVDVIAKKSRLYLRGKSFGELC